IILFYFSLRWYILGKHSDIIFTENTNSEVGLETSLLDGQDCLVGQMFKSLDLLETSVPESNSNIVNVQSNNEVITGSISKTNLDLLEKFELETIEPFEDLEEECVEYVGGYIANRFFVKYPYLTNESSDSKVIDSWTKFISTGNLKIPSDDLLRAMKIVEIDFKELHGNYLNKEPNIIKQLSNNIMRKINNIPEEVIRCIIRTRTYIRINNLNKDVLKTNHKYKTKQKFTK
ncbi:Uncharacterized protein FWK35_00031260, partial [Aphis craccivora]